MLTFTDIISLLLISAIVSISGTLVVFRKASFLVASVSHSALAGVAFSILLASFGFYENYYLFALLFAIISAFVAVYASKFREVDTGIAISFALFMSLMVIFLSFVKNVAAKIWTFFFGDLLLLTMQDLVYLSISAALVTLIFSFFYKKFIFFLFDPEGAEADGLNVLILDLLLTLVLCISIVAVMKAVGAILAYAIFIAPAAIAKEIAKSSKDVLVFTFITALTSLLAGSLASFAFQISASATSAFLASVAYIAVFFARNR